MSASTSAIGVRRSAITCATSCTSGDFASSSAAASGTGPPQTCAIERCGCRRWMQGQSGSGGPAAKAGAAATRPMQQASDHWFPPLRPRQRPLAGSYMKIVPPKKTSVQPSDHREGERVELEIEREADQLHRMGERVQGADVVQEHARSPASATADRAPSRRRTSERSRSSSPRRSSPAAGSPTRSSSPSEPSMIPASTSAGSTVT